MQHLPQHYCWMNNNNINWFGLKTVAVQAQYNCTPGEIFSPNLQEGVGYDITNFQIPSAPVIVVAYIVIQATAHFLTFAHQWVTQQSNCCYNGSLSVSWQWHHSRIA